MTEFPIKLADIQSAERRIRPYLAPSPLHEATSLTAQLGQKVYAKLESMNPTGAFKVRGAFNALLSLRHTQRSSGVVTASAGSHGLGVAYAAARLGVSAEVFVGRESSPAKVAKIRRLGAELYIEGETYDDAHHAALEQVRHTRQPYIHAYEDPRVMAGQGTVGLEILAQLPDVGTVIVPVGGGGLISGIAIAIKTSRPKVKLVSVQPEASPALSRSLTEGKWYETYNALPTIADGVVGGVGHAALELAKRGVIDSVIDLPEAAIWRAVVWALREEQWLIEGAAALTIAALLEGCVKSDGPVCCVITGSNISVETLKKVLAKTNG